MSFFPNKKKSDFVPAPEGLHHSVCVDVVDLGIVESNWQGEKSLKPKVKIVWQTKDKMQNGKPYMISKRYTNSSHPKAGLRIAVSSWRGKAFTDDEFEAFDLEKLIGACCQIQVFHNKVDGETYANIQAIVPATGMVKFLAQDYIRVKDRPDYKPPAIPASQDEDGDNSGNQPETVDDIPF